MGAAGSRTVVNSPMAKEPEPQGWELERCREGTGDFALELDLQCLLKTSLESLTWKENQKLCKLIQSCII